MKTEKTFIDFVTHHLGADGPYEFSFTQDEIEYAVFIRFGEGDAVFERMEFDGVALLCAWMALQVQRYPDQEPLLNIHARRQFARMNHLNFDWRTSHSTTLPHTVLTGWSKAA